MKIGILGGTFDPVHWGHLFMAEVAREKVGLDCVYFAPANIPPHKKQATATAKDRLAMLELSLAENPFFKIGLWDYERKTPAFTYQTMAELSRKFPDAEIYFIVGGDSLRDFSTWKKPEEIIRHCKVIGIARPEADFSHSEFIKEHVKDFILIDSPPIGISSTEIRNRLQAGLDVRYYLHPAAYEYLKLKKIYAKKASTLS